MCRTADPRTLMRIGSYTLIKGYNMNELRTLVQQLEAEIASYDAKPTKIRSLQIRKLTQRLNNIGPSVRKELIAADSKGY